MSYIEKTNLAKRANYGNKRNVSAIKYIVFHYTGNDGDTDENNGKYFHNNTVYASAHDFIDSNSITHSVPHDYVAYSVGGNKYGDCAKTGGGKYYGKCTNANSLNIELCDDVKNGTIYPSTKTIANAIEYAKKMMKKYNVPKENVIRHFDVNGKHCPAYWIDDAKWKSEFWNKLSSSSTTSSSTTSAKKKEYLNLYASSADRTVYNASLKKVGTIKPHNFGGLSYEILGYTNSNRYVRIKTRDFGEVRICVDKKTVGDCFSISTTKKY